MDIEMDSENGVLEFGPKHEHHLGRCILKCLEQHKDKIFQIEAISGYEETFGSFRSRTIRLARALKAKGLVSGDEVAIFGANHKDINVPFIGSLYVGIIPTFMSVRMNYDDVKHRILQSKPNIIFSDPSILKIIEQVIEDIEYDIEIVVFRDKEPDSNHMSFSELLEVTKDEENFSCVDIDLETTALTICSSGTTGPQKLVAYSHKAVYPALTATLFLDKRSKMQTEGLYFNIAPMAWVSSVVALLGCITTGKGFLLMNKPFSSALVKDVIEKYRPSAALSGPYSTFELVKHPDTIDLSSFRNIYLGGGYCSQIIYNELKQRCRDAEIVYGYGSTEFGIICCTEDTRDQRVGRFYPWIEWKVVDQDTEEKLGPHQNGEVRVKTEYWFKGYHKNPQATAATFDSEGFYKTGDVVKYDEDGNIYIVDRIKDIIKYSGNYVSTSLLNDIISAIPEVYLSTVVGIPHVRDGDVPTAFVQLVPGAKISSENIKEQVNSKVSDGKGLAGDVIFVEKIPHTVSGKIDRKAMELLKKEYMNNKTIKII